MNREVYGLLATALDYPGSALPGAVDRLLEMLPEISHEAAKALNDFRDQLQSVELTGLQEWYIRTFDFRADASLYIGHHLFGETGRRGVFIAELTGRYQKHQLPATEDLPDHISGVLRYLGTLEPGEEASELVHACLIPALSRINAVEAIAASPYRAVLEALPGLLQQIENDSWPSGELAWIPSYSSPFPILL